MPLPTAYGTIPLGGALPEAYIPVDSIPLLGGALESGYGEVSYAVNMTAAASGSNGITVADDDDIDFGTGDFFLHWEGSLPDWTPGAFQRVIRKYDAAAAGFVLGVNTNGTFAFSLFAGAGVLSYDSTSATGLQDGSIAKVTVSVVRSSASAAGSVTFYLNGTQLGSPVSIAAAASITASTSTAMAICGGDGTTGTQRTASNTISCIVGNFAPTASEVLDLCTNGIPASWKWGSKTNIGPTNGDFETWTVPTNPDTWSEGSNVSASVSQVTGGSQYAGTYSLQFTGAGLPSSTFNNTIFQSNFWSNPVLGKKYRIRVAAKRTSGSGDLYIGQGGTEFSSISTASGLSTSWALFTIEKTITSNAGNASSFVIAGASGSVFQVDAITVEQIGATMALLPDTIPTSSATTWSDTSGKTGGGTLPAAGATKVTIRR